MTVWHWVRHGPTHARSFVGWRDVPADLSDTARISRLRAHLPAAALLISSDLVRATATADVIQGDGYIRLAHDPALREFDFGAWDGLHFSEVAARDPDLSRAYWENPGDIAPPDGESWNVAADRIGQAVQRLSAAYPDQHIVAVAHFGTILTQVQRALGLTPAQALCHRIDNLSVTEIRTGPDGVVVPHINHLP